MAGPEKNPERLGGCAGSDDQRKLPEKRAIPADRMCLLVELKALIGTMSTAVDRMAAALGREVAP